MNNIGLPNIIFYIKNSYYNPLLSIKINRNYFKIVLDSLGKIIYNEGVNKKGEIK